METSHLAEHLQNPENFRRFQEEGLLLDVALLIHSTMDKKGITPKQLADALGVTKGRISQYVCGERNLRLRTLADIFTALGCRLSVCVEKIAEETTWQQVERVELTPKLRWVVAKCLSNESDQIAA